MIRLHVLGEGSTEKRFVESLLIDHLVHHDIVADVCCFLTRYVPKTGRQFKGGVSNYAMVRKDIMQRIRADNNLDCRLTTMIDLYGLPSDFPGYNDLADISDPYQKVAHLEAAFAKDIDDGRFIPYIQLHEFEALIFADPGKLAEEYLDNTRQIENLESLSRQFEPEKINDNPATSPSHRILAAIPAYDKPYAAARITELIGLEKIRQRCPHFHGWLTKLEGLAN